MLCKVHDELTITFDGSSSKDLANGVKLWYFVNNEQNVYYNENYSTPKGTYRLYFTYEHKNDYGTMSSASCTITAKVYFWENSQQTQFNSNNNGSYTIDISKDTNNIEALRFSTNCSNAINLYEDYQRYTNVKLALISLTIPESGKWKLLSRVWLFVTPWTI